MKLRKMFRLAGILGVAAPLLATGAPPASATEVGSIVFVGTATVTCPTSNGGGLGYPITTKTTPPSLKSGKNCSWTFGSVTCVAVNLTVGKPKPTAQASPFCAIAAGGFLTGFCGLSSGTGAGGVTVTDPITGAVQAYGLTNLGFTGAGGTLLVHSGISKGASKGVAEAVVEAVPIPTVSTPGGTVSNTCSNNSATTFTIAGSAAFAIIT